MRALAIRLALYSLCLALAGCGGSSTSGTYVHVRFSAGSGLDASTAAKIDVTAMLAGQTAMVTVGNGTSIALPTDKVLQIEHGAGTITVSATLLDVDGTTLADASGSVAVTRGATVDLPLAFVAVMPPPPTAVAMLTMDHQPSYDFGTVVTGTKSAPVTLTVTNSGTAASSMIMPAALAAANTQFVISSDGCAGMMLEPNTSCTVVVALNAATVGTAMDTLSLFATSGGTVSTQLTGTVVAPGTLAFTPAMHDFMGVAVGSSVDQQFTLTNSGNVTSGTIKVFVTGSDAASFTLVSNQCDGVQLPVGLSCTVTVRFTAASPSGSRSATVEADATPGGPAVANLAGLAQNPAQLSVMPGTTYDFMTVDVTTPQSVTFFIKNIGDLPSGTLGAQPWLSGDAAFSASGGTCASGNSLNGGDQCSVIITFAPTTYGSRAATLSLGATPGGTINVALSGTGQVTTTLTVSDTGNGSGTITMVPAGAISCGSTCSAPISATDAAPTITLQATPAATSVFAGWTGCTPVSGTPTQCTIVMSSAESVSAAFNLTPAVLAISPTTDDFGYTTSGASTTATFTVSNSGNAPSGALSALPWVSGNAAFTISGGTCAAGGIIGGKLSCTIIVKFAPTTQGVITGTLALSANPGGPVSATLTGESCTSANHMCSSACYTAADRQHCGSGCAVCSATQVCDGNSCVTAPVASIASSPIDPTGWLDANGKAITVSVTPLSLPGVTYECRTGPESTFTTTVPAFAACDGASGTGTTHTPTSNATTPEGSYRTEVRYLAADYTSPVAAVRYYTHHSLDKVPLCPRSATDAPHFTDAQYFAVAQAFSSANPTLYPTTGVFPAPGNPVAWTDAIVLRNPFTKLPFVGIDNIPSMGWATSPNQTVTEPMLRHRLVLSSTRNLLLLRRGYPSYQTGDCSLLERVRNPIGPLKQGLVDCEAMVLNTSGQGLCIVSNNLPTPSPIVLPYDVQTTTLATGVGVLSVTKGNATVTSTSAFDTTMKNLVYGAYLYNVTSISGTSAVLSPAPPYTASIPNGSWGWTASPSVTMFRAGWAKIYDDGHVTPGHRTKCATPGCNASKPWLLYLPQ